MSRAKCMALPEVKCRCNRLAAFLTNLGRRLGVRIEDRQPGLQWPLFYQLKTLKVLRAKFAPGKANEHDVPGLYAQVILQPRALSREKRYGEGGSYRSNVTLRTSQTK